MFVCLTVCRQNHVVIRLHPGSFSLMRIAIISSLHFAFPTSSLVCWLYVNWGNCLALGVQFPLPACSATMDLHQGLWKPSGVYVPDTLEEWLEWPQREPRGRWRMLLQQIPEIINLGRAKVDLGLTHLEFPEHNQLASLPLGLGKGAKSC